MTLKISVWYCMERWHCLLLCYCVFRNTEFRWAERRWLTTLVLTSGFSVSSVTCLSSLLRLFALLYRLAVSEWIDVFVNVHMMADNLLEYTIVTVMYVLWTNEAFSTRLAQLSSPVLVVGSLQFSTWFHVHM